MKIGECAECGGHEQLYQCSECKKWFCYECGEFCDGCYSFYCDECDKLREFMCGPNLCPYCYDEAKYRHQKIEEEMSIASDTLSSKENE